MFAPILIISFIALVVWALWSLARPRAAFVIRITHGVPRVAHGTVTAAFLHEVARRLRASCRGRCRGARRA